MDLIDQIKKRFEVQYQRQNTPWVRTVVAEDIVRFTKMAQRLFPGGRILDLGCGDGWIAVYLSQQGFSVVGIDSSPTAIAQAKQKAQEVGLTNIEFQEGDALDFPYADNSFDIVLDRGLLHHLPESEWEKYQAGVLRVLQPNGLFYLAVFSDKSPKHDFTPDEVAKMWRQTPDDTGYTTYDHLFNRDLIAKLFGDKFEIMGFDEDIKASPNGSLLLYVTARKW